MVTATVSPKGWVVIPKEMRKNLGLKPGTKVSFVDAGGRGVYLLPVPDDPVSALYGMLAGPGRPWTEILLEERQAERAREEAKIARWMGRSGESQ